MKKKKLFAFTLAEVLITLSILGVVAAITVPSLVNKNSEREVITKLKKNYSVLSDAFDTMVAEEGTSVEGFMKQYNTGDRTTDSRNVFNIFRKYLNISKDCGIGSVNSCKPSDIQAASHKNLNNVNSAISPSGGTNEAVANEANGLVPRNTSCPIQLTTEATSIPRITAALTPL